MGVSKNRGTLKSSILIGFSIISPSISGVFPLFLETPIYKSSFFFLIPPKKIIPPNQSDQGFLPQIPWHLKTAWFSKLSRFETPQFFGEKIPVRSQRMGACVLVAICVLTLMVPRLLGLIFHLRLFKALLELLTETGHSKVGTLKSMCICPFLMSCSILNLDPQLCHSRLWV